MPIVVAKQSNLFTLRKAKSPDTPIELQIIAAKLPEPVQEYPFAETIGRKWRADLAWPSYRILFEIEGAAFGNLIHVAPGSWTTKKVNGEKQKVVFDDWQQVRLGGRHNVGAGMQNDCEKYSQAAILGWLVVRATGPMIRDGLAIELLEAAFAARRREGYPK